MLVSALLQVVCAILIFIKCVNFAFSRPPNFPPGPPRLPIVGSYFFLCLLNSRHLHKAAIWLGKFYKSNVIGFYLGNYLAVVALDQASVRSVLTENDFDGRPDTFVIRMRDPQNHIRGIFFTESAFWKEQRRFFLRHLRDYGFGRRFQELEIGMLDEVQEFINMIRGGPQFPHERRVMKSGGLICAPDLFFSFTGNAFLRIFTGGKSMLREEQGQLLHVGLNAMKFHKHAETYGRLLTIIPWIRYLLPNWSGYTPIFDANASVYQFVDRLIDSELQSWEEEEVQNSDNFIQLYGEKMKFTKNPSNPESSSYHREQLKVSFMDFLFAAITTLPVQISFLLQHLLLQPAVLKRIQSEIDDVVGGGRLPTLDDRINLPYTEACIREIARLETIAPNALGHKALNDCKLAGYDIPKDTVVLPTLYAFHRDPTVWGSDAERFRPERFLDEDGKLSLKLDKSLPFGAGKRLCAGETFARNTLFLLLSALFQNFNIELPAGQSVNLQDNQTGFIRYTPPFWVKLINR